MKLNLVPARRGAQWVRSGAATFARQPLALGGMFFLFFGLMALLGQIPVVGTLLSLVLLPAATAGLLQAARIAEAGRFPMPSVLAAALSASAAQRNAILKLGAYYALALLLCLAVTMLFDGGTFARLYLVGGEINQAAMHEDDIQLAAAVGTVLYLPLALMFWHAPALVFWWGVAPAQAMFYSLMACWKNAAAILVFIATWGAVFLAIALLATLLGALLGTALLGQIIIPLAMILAAVVTVSVLFSVRDSFDQALPPLPGKP